MKQVEVSRKLLIGLVAACAAAFLALAYMLGRASAGSRSALAAPAAQAPVSPPSAEPQAAPPAEPASAPGPMPPAPLQAAPQAPRPAAASKGADPVGAGVASYFQALEQIQPGQMSGDPEGMAKGVLEGVVKGDTSGIDGMIQQSEAARAKLGALTPPAPCVAFHHESLAALDDSLGILRSLRTGLQAGSLPAEFATQAEGLRTRTERLQKEEKALREKYQLAH
jgi:hypothetical protein